MVVGDYRHHHPLPGAGLLAVLRVQSLAACSSFRCTQGGGPSGSPPCIIVAGAQRNGICSKKRQPRITCYYQTWKGGCYHARTPETRADLRMVVGHHRYHHPLPGTRLLAALRPLRMCCKTTNVPQTNGAGVETAPVLERQRPRKTSMAKTDVRRRMSEVGIFINIHYANSLEFSDFRLLASDLRNSQAKFCSGLLVGSH